MEDIISEKKVRVEGSSSTSNTEGKFSIAPRAKEGRGKDINKNVKRFAGGGGEEKERYIKMERDGGA